MKALNASRNFRKILQKLIAVLEKIWKKIGTNFQIKFVKILETYKAIFEIFQRKFSENLQKIKTFKQNLQKLES